MYANITNERHHTARVALSYLISKGGLLEINNKYSKIVFVAMEMLKIGDPMEKTTLEDSRRRKKNV